MENCHPEKTNVYRGEAKVDIGFRRVTISHYPLVQSIFIYYTECWLNTSSTLCLVLKNPGQVNIWVRISYSVNSNAHTTPVRIYGEPHTHIFCAVDIFFGNITRRQAISPVAKFHHVLGCGFMIQWVILIFIKCFSANQNQLFYTSV